ncbi:hypothetical protein E3N88_07124 [Mikania micrantha]|uniref:Uncharacterized protein n=1 Tax=Mikania micrantha TaxID=192012 RepID=A0A5N6PQP8_9ASTR|nr:hypothetical protein E3N88_07124 [Mikania micrantha]
MDPSPYARILWRKASRHWSLKKVLGAIKSLEQPSTSSLSSSEAVLVGIYSSKVLTSRTASFHNCEHHIDRDCSISPTIESRMAIPIGGWNSA